MKCAVRLQKRDPEIYGDEDVKNLFATGRQNKTTNTSKATPQDAKEANTTAPSPAPSKTPLLNITNMPSGPNKTGDDGNNTAPALTGKAPAPKDKATLTDAKVGLGSGDMPIRWGSQ